LILIEVKFLVSMHSKVGDAFRNTKSYPIAGVERPLGLQEVGTRRISTQSARKGGKVVSPIHLQVFVFVRGRVDPRAIALTEGLSQ
jgi:hypothetical protein